MRKGCGREYQPRRWNQRYCQEPECLRQVRQWQAARRQAKHRQAAEAKARHAQAEHEHVSGPRLRPRLLNIQRLHRRVVTQQNFFSAPLCDRPGCHEHPVTSLRNPARYCCSACRQAVRNVLDRERKWLARGTLEGRKKRAYEYQAARWRRSSRRCNTSAPASSRPPPE